MFLELVYDIMSIIIHDQEEYKLQGKNKPDHSLITTDILKAVCLKGSSPNTHGK